MSDLKNIAERPNEEIAKLKSRLNLTDEESVIFDMAMKDKTTTQMSNKLHISDRTVYRRIKRIEKKIDLLEYLDMFK